MKFVPVARIVGAHGLKGYLKIEPLTDFMDRFEPGARLRLEGDWVTVRALAFHDGRPRIQLESVRDRTTAEGLRGKTLEAADTPVELEEDEFMVRDLIGCSVVTTAGADIGTVDDVQAMPAHDLLVVGETLIPFAKAFVKAVNLADKLVTVELIPGMLPGTEAVE